MLEATSSSFVVEVPLLTVEVLELSSPVLPLQFRSSVPILPSSISEILSFFSREQKVRLEIVVRVSSHTPAGRQGTYQTVLESAILTRNVDFPSDFPKMTFYISKSYIRNPSYNNATLNYKTQKYQKSNHCVSETRRYQQCNFKFKSWSLASA